MSWDIGFVKVQPGTKSAFEVTNMNQLFLGSPDDVRSNILDNVDCGSDGADYRMGIAVIDTEEFELSIGSNDHCSDVWFSFREGVSDNALDKLSSLSISNGWQFLDGQSMEIVDLKTIKLSLGKWIDFRDKIVDGDDNPLDSDE